MITPTTSTDMTVEIFFSGFDKAMFIGLGIMMSFALIMMAARIKRVGDLLESERDDHAA